MQASVAATNRKIQSLQLAVVWSKILPGLQIMAKALEQETTAADELQRASDDIASRALLSALQPPVDGGFGAILPADELDAMTGAFKLLTGLKANIEAVVDTLEYATKQQLAKQDCFAPQ